MKIKTTLAHRANKRIAFPPPVGEVDFDANLEAEVTDEHAAILVKRPDGEIVLADEADADKLPVVPETDESTPNPDASKDSSNLPPDDGSEDEDGDPEIAKIKKMDKDALRVVCSDMGLPEAEWEGFTTKPQLVKYITSKLK